MNKLSYRSFMTEQDDHSLINFIAATVETMREQMTTKEDIVRLESRMEAMRESLESRMATKEELSAVTDRIAMIEKRMATKDDLARLATTVQRDFEQVHFRFDTLERVMNTRFA